MIYPIHIIISGLNAVSRETIAQYGAVQDASQPAFLRDECQKTRGCIHDESHVVVHRNMNVPRETTMDVLVDGTVALFHEWRRGKE